MKMRIEMRINNQLLNPAFQESYAAGKFYLGISRRLQKEKKVHNNFEIKNKKTKIMGRGSTL